MRSWLQRKCKVVFCYRLQSLFIKLFGMQCGLPCQVTLWIGQTWSQLHELLHYTYDAPNPFSLQIEAKTQKDESKIKVKERVKNHKSPEFDNLFTLIGVLPQYWCHVCHIMVYCGNWSKLQCCSSFISTPVIFQLLYGNEFFRVVFAGPRIEAYCFCPLVLLTGRTTITNYFGYKW